MVGEQGEIRISEEGGNFAPVEGDLEETFHGAEVMDDGTVIAVGDDGVIVEGLPK